MNFIQFINESKLSIEVSEGTDLNFTLKPGVILNFKDGETWKVTKVIGNANNPRGVMANPYGDTKKQYVSVAIEFTIDQLKSDLQISESNTNSDEYEETHESKVSESKITLKRQYTNNHPEITVGKDARVRNKVIEAIKDGKISQDEFDSVIREMSTDAKRWMRRNSQFFNVSEDGISLSKIGNRILKSIMISEANKQPQIWVPAGFEKEISKYTTSQITRDIVLKAAKKWNVDSEDAIQYYEYAWGVNLTENKNTKTIKTKFIFESFKEFTESLNEAFGSAILAAVLTGKGTKTDKDLTKAFYGKTKLALDKIQDEDIIVTDPMTAYKEKSENTIVFYVSDNEKPNPYAPSDAFHSNKTIPGGAYLLALTTGDNSFYENSWKKGLITTGDTGADSVGISKRYKGWDATGLYNVKRIAEVADRAIIINLSLLQQKYSTANLKAERSAAQAGATAFQSDKDFKSENLARYHTILATNAVSLPLDKMVADAIDALAAQIKSGLASGEKTKYGEPMIGTSSKGKEVKLKDASQHMNNILDDYSRYADYTKQEADEIATYGKASNWYSVSAKDYAKRCVDNIKKIEGLTYAW